MRREPLEEGAEDGTGLHRLYGTALSMRSALKRCSRIRSVDAAPFPIEVALGALLATASLPATGLLTGNELAVALLIHPALYRPALTR